jgi:3-phenylpropionate/trans-cinnamate dioxygenase ferredoxin reductase component
MASFKYVIVGAGMTADSAVHGIRELDTTGSIALIGNDHHLPYKRPPLSKGLWAGKPLESIWLNTPNLSIDLFLGRIIKSINPGEKTVRDDSGDQYTYDKLLLATGGSPRRLPFGEEINYFRTLDDYQQLRDLSSSHNQFGVIGGGFIGSEIAAALKMNSKNVSMVFPEEGIGSRLFPHDLSLFLNEYYRKKGVEVISGANVKDVIKRDASLFLMHDKGEYIQVDGVVAGIGSVPNIELATSSGIKTGNGIVVNEYLQTDNPDIFAAGDVAEFNQSVLGIRRRVEHEDNANIMGKQAGRNMAGANEPYNHLPYFYSDMFELGYEAVGEMDSRLETFSDWQEPYKKGVIYYLSKGRVHGVLLWNVWDSIPAARDLIAQPGPFKSDDLKGRFR